jgi:hypothetical protein
VQENPAVSSIDCWQPRNLCNQLQTVDEFFRRETLDAPRKGVGRPGIAEPPGGSSIRDREDGLQATLHHTHGCCCRSVKPVIAFNGDRLVVLWHDYATLPEYFFERRHCLIHLLFFLNV